MQATARPVLRGRNNILALSGDHLNSIHRPVTIKLGIVLRGSSAPHNAGLMVCCPMNSRIKEHPFEVLVAVRGVAGAVLSDRLRSLDWKVRCAREKDMVPAATMAEVRAKNRALLAVR